ncbi:LPXTG cell wall anchor domain-containing protein [Aerococcaceae bacterium WGS1372]
MLPNTGEERTDLVVYATITVMALAGIGLVAKGAKDKKSRN